MDKKELWLALSAFGIVSAVSPSTLATPEQVGVASKVNPAVTGQIPKDASRVLFVGSGIFREEVIQTDDAGLTHLMFADQSSLTIGPNSKLTIDHFVYDPQTNKGELSMSAAKGVLRFVGGASSKSGGCTVKTPLGNLGIRGAVALVDLNAVGGKVSACLLYGDQLSGTVLESGLTKTVQEHENCVILTPDGQIVTEPVSSEHLQKILGALEGPASNLPPSGHQVALPENYENWAHQLDEQDHRDEIRDDERFRDIDGPAS